MKTFFYCIFFSVLFLGCGSQKLIDLHGDYAPLFFLPVYKGLVTIAFCKITLMIV